MSENEINDADLTIINYCHTDCESLKNIMLLPKDEAFAVASQLASTHPGTTAFLPFCGL